MNNLANYSTSATKSNKSIITFKDKGESRKISFNNPEQLEIIEIKIDGGLICNVKMVKCDYMLYIPSGYKYRENYIELKGSDIAHAVEQIISTVQYLLRNASGSIKKDNERKGYIISRRVPKADTSVQTHKERMKKSYSLNLVVRTGTFTETLAC